MATKLKETLIIMLYANNIFHVDVYSVFAVKGGIYRATHNSLPVLPNKLSIIQSLRFPSKRLCEAGYKRKEG